MLLAIAYAAFRGKLGAVVANLSGTARGLLQPIFGVGTYRDAARLMPEPGEGLQMPYGLAIFTGTALAAGGIWIWQSW
jgi:hypothetical protein